MTSVRPITWRNTFDYSQKPTHWMSMYECLDFARRAGYPYMNWNGTIYRTSDESNTGYRASDLT